MRHRKVLCAITACAVALCTLASSAKAHTITFVMQSLYPYTVQVEFYSTWRSYAWPGGNFSYNLHDSGVHTFTLRCRRGEKICYGAWPTGNPSRYWGAGYGGRQGCTNCCTRCTGGSVRYTLN